MLILLDKSVRLLYIAYMNNQPDRSMMTLIHAAGVMQERMERALESVGLSSAKYGPLSVLLDADAPLPLGELAARVHCVRSNMTQLVDRLEAEGLVTRTNDPSDRRVVRAEITTKGREQTTAGRAKMNAIEKEFAEALSDDDRAAIERILTAVR